MTGAAKAAPLEIALSPRAESIARALHVFRVREPARRAAEW
jgi:hypothetical protein